MMVNDDQKFIIRHLSMHRSMQSKHTYVYESLIRVLSSTEKVNISFIEVCTKLEFFAQSSIISKKGASLLHVALVWVKLIEVHER